MTDGNERPASKSTNGNQGEVLIPCVFMQNDKCLFGFGACGNNCPYVTADYLEGAKILIAEQQLPGWQLQFIIKHQEGERL